MDTKSVRLFFTIIVVIYAYTQSVSANGIVANGMVAGTASNSVDLMCRNKAKEIAAETYKSCITESKQAQVSSLRDEYKAELTDVKNRYDEKLKKISEGQSETTQSVKVKAQDSDSSLRIKSEKQSKSSQRNGRVNKRASGAREIPLKDEDLSSNNTDVSTVEIVELPIESE